MTGCAKKKGVRILLWVLILELLLSSCVLAAGAVRYTRKKVNLYAEKSNKSRVLCSVPGGEALRLLERKAKWSLVSYTDEGETRYKGYVLSEYLSKKKPDEEESAERETPEPVQTPKPEGTPPPESTPDPADVPETEDASDQENPAPGEERDRERETRLAERRKIIRSWAGKIVLGKGGLPIPKLFQDDYPEPVCEIDGVERSVASSGCGAVCLSMVISHMTGYTEQDPRTIFTEAWEQGRYRGNGLNRNAIMKIAKSYGLLGQWKNLNKKELIAALKEEKPVIARMGFGFFTEGGHYIVLRGLTRKDKVLVNDPNSRANSRKAFPVELFIKESKPGASFLVFTGIDGTKVRVNSAPAAEEENSAAAPASVEAAEGAAPETAAAEGTASLEAAA